MEWKLLRIFLRACWIEPREYYSWSKKVLAEEKSPSCQEG
jgi:hypothetical protein